MICFEHVYVIKITLYVYKFIIFIKYFFIKCDTLYRIFLSAKIRDVHKYLNCEMRISMIFQS